ncbi:MAG: hypothetical protein H6R02_2756 [Burkholderiaceae bacterium]|nr:hypothetical protein [Burkholderiaceae bacterium]
MSQTLAQTPVPAPPRRLLGPGDDFLGHPRGLTVLAAIAGAGGLLLLLVGNWLSRQLRPGPRG